MTFEQRPEEKEPAVRYLGERHSRWWALLLLSRSVTADPRDCSLPGSFVHGVYQARVLEWGAIAFSARWREGQVKRLEGEQAWQV